VSTTARLRLNRIALVPVAFLALCAVPLATVSTWTLVVFLVPLAVAVWVLRSGLDIGDEGLTVHSLVGSRTVRWSELAGIRVADRGALWLVTTGGTEVRMPCIRARDLPRLAELSGGRIEVPAPPSADQ
jgi:hypothetical protein